MIGIVVGNPKMGSRTLRRGRDGGHSGRRTLAAPLADAQRLTVDLAEFGPQLFDWTSRPAVRAAVDARPLLFAGRGGLSRPTRPATPACSRPSSTGSAPRTWRAPPSSRSWWAPVPSTPWRSRSTFGRCWSSWAPRSRREGCTSPRRSSRSSTECSGRGWGRRARCCDNAAVPTSTAGTHDDAGPNRDSRRSRSPSGTTPHAPCCCSICVGPSSTCRGRPMCR